MTQRKQENRPGFFTEKLMAFGHIFERGTALLELDRRENGTKKVKNM